MDPTATAQETTKQTITTRWWQETRFNARSFTKQRRIGSDPSSSIRVETGTAGNISHHHTPSNSVTSIPEMAGAGTPEGLNELSTKLVEAVEKQADLEDTLAVTRHELEVANQKVKQLEQIQKEYSDMMERGMLIEKREVEMETTELTRRLLEESKNRVQAENDKNMIEQELETLTAKLFEEANNLVASARRESKALEKRNDQLQSRLEDTETLLQSQQEQLAELKAVMQRMEQENDHLPGGGPNLVGKASRESLGRLGELSLSPLHISTPHLEIDPAIDSARSTEFSPFPFVVRPQYRYDTPAYADFKSFVRISKANLQPHQRQHSYPSTVPVASSTYFVAVAFSGKDSPPPRNHQTTSSSTYSPQAERLPLKEWRFVKRALTEDIEPTLRLDIAPGLSWIARRNVQSAVLEGTLIIEPTPANSIMLTYACTLCGERREGKLYARTHRFCTNENATTQKYPLCGYCLERMRVTCDFVAFLRSVRDGIWKIEGQEQEEKAWDESVRLRERMFWARLGTQSFAPEQGSPKDALKERTDGEQRLSSETLGSGLDPLAKPPVNAEEGQPASKLTEEITKSSEEIIKEEETVEPVEHAEADGEGGTNGEEKQVEPVNGEEHTEVGAQH